MLRPALLFSYGFTHFEASRDNDIDWSFGDFCVFLTGDLYRTTKRLRVFANFRPQRSRESLLVRDRVSFVCSLG